MRGVRARGGEGGEASGWAWKMGARVESHRLVDVDDRVKLIQLDMREVLESA